MTYKMVLLGCMIVAQIAVPVWMITDHERTLRDGEEFRFRSRAVDPADLFRGRYVAIGVESVSGPYHGDAELERGQTVYAYLDRDEEDFAFIREVSVSPPEDDTPYIAVPFSNLHFETGDAFVRMPFERYYMEESAAPVAEVAYFRSVRDEEGSTYITVRVRDGKAAIDGLFINDQPVLEYLSTFDPQA